MYSHRPGLILGFHGCDESVIANVLSGTDALRPSENAYDWLGHGIYFWEYSPTRALQYAQVLQERPQRANRPIHKPAVLGAVLSLGNCLDLLDAASLKVLEEGFEVAKSIFLDGLPDNAIDVISGEILLRYRDCAVIEVVHEALSPVAGYDLSKKPYDSVRGAFFEGQPIYENSGFRKHDHLQVCIRNPNCIKGYFVPRELNEAYARV